MQWLRRDYRTARIPVGVMARGELLDRPRMPSRTIRSRPSFRGFIRPKSAAFEIAKLEAIAGRNRVDRDERIDQASAALAALGQLAAQPANSPVTSCCGTSRP